MTVAPRIRPGIRVVTGGPMLVEGPTLTRLVRDVAGDQALRPVEPSTERYALCRCARSTTMPFCDGEPPYACFEEQPQGGGPVPKPFRWDVPDPSRPGLALKPDGPVRVAGGVPIETDGGEVLRADRLSLCRCGASRSQPLCDGSHKVVGFREPRDPPEI